MAERTLAHGRYALEPSPTARGGMGEVWFGRDVKLDRPVAVKFLRMPGGDDDQELVARFVRESRITARLEHPGVPTVFDVGTDEGRPYVVLQRVRGATVADLIVAQGALPVGWSASIATQVCAVLAAAHGASLTHRDLKPANVMLCPDGTVKVLDFGLAVALDRDDHTRLTRTGLALGTPAYMAPEQILAGGSDPRSDLYSVGCTLFEMLTGRQVFSGDTAYIVMRKQVDEPPPSVRTLRTDLPTELDRLVRQLLHKNPGERPSSAEETAHLLLPFVAVDEPLPGIRLDARATTITLYAAAAAPSLDIAQVSVGTTPSQAGTEPTTSMQVSTRSRLAAARVRAEAKALSDKARYDQAVEVIERALRESRSIGKADPEVEELRRQYADALFAAGDFRRAAPAYRVVTDALRDPDGQDMHIAFRCRFREATSRALTGQTRPALRELIALLVDEEQAYGSDDSRPLGLRRQIALLELGTENRQQATDRLQTLLDDLLRLRGEGDPDVVKVRDLLDGARLTSGA